MRSAILKERRALSASLLRENSKAIVEKLLGLSLYQNAKTLAIYKAFAGEVNLNELLRLAPIDGKKIFLPVVDERADKLLFVEVDENTKLTKTKLGVYEPTFSKENSTDASELDLLLMPLVGFDKHCNRLGLGGGFYDKTLAGIKEKAQVKLVGIAHELQNCKALNPAPWDIKLDYILTEQHTYPRGG